MNVSCCLKFCINFSYSFHGTLSIDAFGQYYFHRVSNATLPFHVFHHQLFIIFFVVCVRLCCVHVFLCVHHVAWAGTRQRYTAPSFHHIRSNCQLYILLSMGADIVVKQFITKNQLNALCIEHCKH